MISKEKLMAHQEETVKTENEVNKEKIQTAAIAGVAAATAGAAAGYFAGKKKSASSSAQERAELKAVEE